LLHLFEEGKNVGEGELEPAWVQASGQARWGFSADYRDELGLCESLKGVLFHVDQRAAEAIQQGVAQGGYGGAVQ